MTNLATPIDTQLPPAIAYIAVLLRSGYSFRQTAEFLAEDGPAPLAAVFRRLADDMRLGVDSGEALNDLQRRFPSAYFSRFITTITQQRRVGGNLAALLEPLGVAIRERVGSEGATPAQLARLASIEGAPTAGADFAPAAPRPWAPAPPIWALLDDPELSEVLIDGPYHIDVVRHGRLEQVDAHFLDDAELQEWVRGVTTPLGHEIDPQRPLLNLRLRDESTMSVILPPVSPNGTAVVLRKAPSRDLSADDAVRFGALSPEIIAFLRACVEHRINLLIAGGAASGKTSLMNLLCTFISEQERVVSVESPRELRIKRQRWLALEAGAHAAGGRQLLSAAELIEQAAHMLPERLVVGELRGGEALVLARTINLGHGGSLASLHANSPRDALVRLEQMVMMAEPALPLRAVRHELATAFQVIVQINRMADGVRRVTSICEIVGMEGESVALREIFQFVAGERAADGRISGQFVATGYLPTFLAQLDGYALPHPSAAAATDPALDSQLAESAALMSALLRAGYSFAQTLGILAQALPAPSAPLWSAVVQAVNGGRPFGAALEDAARTSGSAAVQLVVSAVIRQRSEGGNLAEQLAALAERLRRMYGDDPALTSLSDTLRSEYNLAPRN